jgi:hypothetical protein
MPMAACLFTPRLPLPDYADFASEASVLLDPPGQFGADWRAKAKAARLRYRPLKGTDQKITRTVIVSLYVPSTARCPAGICP